MNLLLLPGPRVPALDLNNPGSAVRAKSMPLAQAWSPLQCDGHFVGYTREDGSECPRLLKQDQDWAMTQGIALEWLAYDIDNPGHAQWENPEHAESALWAMLDQLPKSLEPYAGGYTTRAGLRLVFHLGTRVPLNYANALLRDVAVLLEDAGIQADPACYQWSRLFRAPRVVRDGKLLVSVTHTPVTLTGDIFKLLNLTPSSVAIAAPLEGDCPTEPLPVPEWIMAKNLRFPEVTRGAPFELSDDKEGGTSLFRAGRSAMAHIAGQARITDPVLLLSTVWHSIVASGREPEEFWKMALWLCAQEKLRSETLLVAPEWPQTAPDHTALPNPPEAWLKAVNALAARQSQSMRELVRLCSKRFPIKVRGSTMFGGLQKLLLDILGATPLAEDPNITFVFVAFSFHETRDPIPEKAQDLWELCLQAAASSRELRITAAEVEESRALIQETRKDWPFLLTTGKHYWVLDARCGEGKFTYINVAGEQVVPVMRLLQRNIGIDIQEVTSGERGGMCTAPQVLDRVGGIVDSIIYESGLPSCKFTDGGSTVRLPCHTRTNINPVFHADVDKWLRLFGGEQYPRLLRWISAITANQLGPAACLYIQGKKGCGKSLFFHIASRLFDGPVVDYNRVANGRFNVELLGSPLLTADEGVHVPKFSGGVSSPSAVFRSFSANFQHAIEEKHSAPTQLNAYLRIGVSANNSDALPFRETLAKEGIDAIVERVFWLNAGEEAARYLDRLFENPAVKHNWVHGGHAAEHFAYLQGEEHGSDGRFLVAGEMTEWHKEFSRNQGLKPSVARVLATLTTDIMRGSTRRRPGVFLTREGLTTTHTKVLDEWPEGQKVPRHSALSRTLEALSTGKIRRSDDGTKPGNRLFYEVPWDTLFESDVLLDSVREKIENTTSWE